MCWLWHHIRLDLCALWRHLHLDLYALWRHLRLNLYALWRPLRITLCGATYASIFTLCGATYALIFMLSPPPPQFSVGGSSCGATYASIFTLSPPPPQFSVGGSSGIVHFQSPYVFPTVICHSRSVPSSLPLAYSSPSGEIRTTCTGPKWPLNDSETEHRIRHRLSVSRQ